MAYQDSFEMENPVAEDVPPPASAGAEADRVPQHAAMRHGSRAVIGRSTDSLSGGVSPR